jgi:hypothetical protein
LRVLNFIVESMRTGDRLIDRQQYQRGHRLRAPDLILRT